MQLKATMYITHLKEIWIAECCVSLPVYAQQWSYMLFMCYHHIFLLVTIFSVFFHCSPKEGLFTIRLLDKAVAHAAYLYVLTDAPDVIASDRVWLLLFPIMTAVLWYMQGLVEERNRVRLHACLHLVGVTGLHCFFTFIR